jgi:type IV pilus assembly protein PilQ
LVVSLDAALKMFESEQYGEVIARPQITVRSGLSSTFQVGQDFSVFEKDFAQNTIQKFYQTGTILTVRPRIFKIGETRFIDVQYRVEKSNFVTGVTTIINKTTASGSLILLDGEEGYIAGMASSDETSIREGVPLLKDLPWWVFGLRYIFGYDTKQVIKRELIVLIKAEILPSIEERASAEPVEKHVIPSKRQEMTNELDKATGKKPQ